MKRIDEMLEEQKRKADEIFDGRKGHEIGVSHPDSTETSLDCIITFQTNLRLDEEREKYLQKLFQRTWEYFIKTVILPEDEQEEEEDDDL